MMFRFVAITSVSACCLALILSALVAAAGNLSATETTGGQRALLMAPALAAPRSVAFDEGGLPSESMTANQPALFSPAPMPPMPGYISRYPYNHQPAVPSLGAGRSAR